MATTQGERPQFFGNFVADTTFLIDEEISQTSVVGSLVVPVGTTVPRVSTFVGGGGGVRVTSTRLYTLLSCAPREPAGCEGRPDVERREKGTALAPLLQVSYGIDVLIQPACPVAAGVRLGLGGKTFETNDGRKSRRAQSHLRTGTMLGLIGAGIGAGIGAVLDAAR